MFVVLLLKSTFRSSLLQRAFLLSAFFLCSPWMLGCETPPAATSDVGSQPQPLPFLYDAGFAGNVDGGAGTENGPLDAGNVVDAGKRGPIGPVLGYNPSAAGSARSTRHRIQFSVGTPLPKGVAQSSGHRLRLTPLRAPIPRAEP